MFQGGHYEGIGIKERRRALEEIYKRFCRKLEHRRQQLNSCLEFYQLAEQVITSEKRCQVVVRRQKQKIYHQNIRGDTRIKQS